MSSLFSEAHIWDSKFPICILPHDSLGTEHVKRSVQETVAAVVGWWVLKSGFNGSRLKCSANILKHPNQTEMLMIFQLLKDWFGSFCEQHPDGNSCRRAMDTNPCDAFAPCTVHRYRSVGRIGESSWPPFGLFHHVWIPNSRPSNPMLAFDHPTFSYNPLRVRCKIQLLEPIHLQQIAMTPAPISCSGLQVTKTICVLEVLHLGPW